MGLIAYGSLSEKTRQKYILWAKMGTIPIQFKYLHNPKGWVDFSQEDLDWFWTWHKNHSNFAVRRKPK